MSKAVATQVCYLYLIECDDGSLYTGITTDAERRYAKHVAGLRATGNSLRSW
jgi:predicted GIY-YIG superfamily endonuclease